MGGFSSRGVADGGDVAASELRGTHAPVAGNGVVRPVVRVSMRYSGTPIRDVVGLAVPGLRSVWYVTVNVAKCMRNSAAFPGCTP